ncbi:MAG TPA: tRNA pseudouridine(55) synthase TruB [Verrucomicrobia bacterium]|nr:tRNA pseudouridine(55) synthase TruB [Verrucomicrobiota bacterium]
MSTIQTFGTAVSAPAGSSDSVDGILLIDKPIGPTSHDIVARIRHYCRIPKVGHGGTLDPMASGLMILLLGKATKLSDRFLGSDKTYEGTMHFGISTDSQDAMGAVLRTADASAVTEEAVWNQMQSRLGDSMQMPPMVSALKVNGVPLYKRARQGIEVERKARLIHLYRFDLHSFTSPCAEFSVNCTKGTYVRTLCADIGDALGCGAHLSRLRRTRCGALSIDDALPLAEALTLSPAQLATRIIPMRNFL